MKTMSPTGQPEVRQSRRDDNAAATRNALVKAARQVFARDGYQASTLEDITAIARVTRGALYHHFGGKLPLFDAVVTEMQATVAGAIEKKAGAVSDVTERLHVGIEVYLDACLRKDFRRLVLEEATGVLGRERLRAIENQHTTRLVLATLTSLQARGHIHAGADVRFLAGMFDSLLCEVALQQAHCGDRNLLRQQTHDLVRRLISGFGNPAIDPNS